MVLAQETADDERAVEALDVRDRHPEPRDAGALPVAAEIRLAQAKVDVVRTERAREPRRERHLLDRRVRRHDRADRRATVLRDDVLEAVGDALQRLVPVDAAPFAVLADHRRRQALLARERLVGEAVLVGDPALVDRLVLERQHAEHAVVLDLDDQVAAVRVVRRHRFAAHELPRPRRVAERLRRERADRADVDHVARELRIDAAADERDDFRVLAAADHPELHHPADLLPEAHAARALDAARHLLGGDERPQLLAEHDALRLVVARRRARRSRRRGPAAGIRRPGRRSGSRADG